MPEWIEQMAYGAIFIFGALILWAAWDYLWKDKDER